MAVYIHIDGYVYLGTGNPYAKKFAETKRDARRHLLAERTRINEQLAKLRSMKESDL